MSIIQASLLIVCTLALSWATAESTEPPGSPGAPTASALATDAVRPLSQADLEAWLDGFLPCRLISEPTLFRVRSVSKLFTWRGLWSAVLALSCVAETLSAFASTTETKTVSSSDPDLLAAPRLSALLCTYLPEVPWRQPCPAYE